MAGDGRKRVVVEIAPHLHERWKAEALDCGLTIQNWLRMLAASAIKASRAAKKEEAR